MIFPWTNSAPESSHCEQNVHREAWQNLQFYAKDARVKKTVAGGQGDVLVAASTGFTRALAIEEAAAQKEMKRGDDTCVAGT